MTASVWLPEEVFVLINAHKNESSKNAKICLIELPDLNEHENLQVLNYIKQGLLKVKLKVNVVRYLII